MNKFKPKMVYGVSPTLWKKVKMEALRRGLTLSIAVSEAIHDWIRKPKEKTQCSKS